MKRIKLKERELPKYTKGEEITNMVTHIVGGAIGVVVLVLAIIFGAVHGSVAAILTGIIFGVTMILLYTISAIYHGLSSNLTAKKVFQVLDHCTIFLLIAGTYTPITVCALVPVAPVMGWVIFGVVWALAILGIVLNAIDIKRFQTFSMVAYLGMGWCVLASLSTLVKVFSPMALGLLVGGGVAYTLGAGFYGWGRKKPYAHAIFHIFVVLGSILHALMILIFVV